jgi:hypothetical protein
MYGFTEGSMGAVVGFLKLCVVQGMGTVFGRDDFYFGLTHAL